MHTKQRITNTMSNTAPIMLAIKDRKYPRQKIVTVHSNTVDNSLHITIAIPQMEHST